MSTHKAQSPNDLLDWARDWSAFLANGDSISTYAWTISPDDSPSHLSDADEANVKVDNLQWGVVYELTLKITTANGIEASRSIALRCGDL